MAATRLNIPRTTILSDCSPYLTLPVSHFVIKSKIDQSTYKASCDHKDYSIKFLYTNAKPFEEADFLVEIILLIQMKHDFTPSLSPHIYHISTAPFYLKVKDTSRRSMFVMEYFQSGDLQTVLSDLASHTHLVQGWQPMLRILENVVKAIAFLHSHQLIHGY